MEELTIIEQSVLELIPRGFERRLSKMKHNIMQCKKL